MSSIYLHIPFCETKCIYCDFYSIENRDSLENFLIALDKEIELRATNDFTTEEVETIFFGGGTPSLLSPLQFEKIFNKLYKYFKISPNAEITTEANPGTVSVEKLKSYRTLGINRISFGAQSFFEDELKFLSRIHSVDEIDSAIRNAKSAGFENINLDLIFALPNQTLERWDYNLTRAINLEPNHISAYSLIVEPNTPLIKLVKSGIVKTLPEELDARFYSHTIEKLNQNGFNQYEISNFSKPGFECKHNLNYWNHTNYISFGPSAHSFWKNENSSKRWWNSRSVKDYIDSVQKNIFPVAEIETLTKENLFVESIFLGLRLGELNLSLINSLYEKIFFNSQ